MCVGQARMLPKTLISMQVLLLPIRFVPGKVQSCTVPALENWYSS